MHNHSSAIHIIKQFCLTLG